MLRVAVGQLPDARADELQFAKQLGVTGVHLNSPPLPGGECWEYADIAELCGRIEAAGLHLEAIENIPDHFYDHAMTGGRKRDRQIDNVATTVRNLGAAGVRILGLHFMPASVWRTSTSTVGRGGALVTSFDLAAALDPTMADSVYVARRDRSLDDPFVRAAQLVDGMTIDDDTMWENYERFMRGVLPAAEEAGVTIALHPDDPPVPRLAGVARLLRSVDAMEQALALVPSPSIALDLCLGTVSEMGGRETVLDAIRRFGPVGKIAYVHMRDVRGTVPNFDECFLGEGNYDPLEVVLELRRVGFEGFVIDDHVPRVTGDTDYMHRGRAHAVGYIQALIAATSESALARP